MIVDICSRKGKILVKSAKCDKLADLNYALISKFPKYTVERQRLTLETGAVLAADLAGLKNGDLGPQISYTTVFFAEYFGPLLLHSLFYLFPKLIYRQAGPISTAQTLGYMLVMLHFIKRELETIHVHRFSNATMPLFNLPKNCFHYWVLGGLFVAYPLYTPGSSSGVHDKIWQLALVLIWITMQMCNLTTHVMLRDLRPPGSKLRQIPRGFMFELVSCPNYLFEILGWVVFSALTGSIPAWIFTIVGAGQMAIWAAKKHKRYRQEFATYPKRRKALIPFIY